MYRLSIFILLFLGVDAAVAQKLTANYLEFDFPAVHIGVAEYEDGPTGTTVFYFPNAVKGAIDVRGGAPGTVNASILENSREAALVDAVVFSGGSWYGLSAATGVADAIKEMKSRQGDRNYIAGVVGAIIYDVGARRFSRVTPDHALGAKALSRAESGRFPLGASGAGRFAMQGWYYGRYNHEGVDKTTPAAVYSGQGAAFRQIGETKIVVFTVVNPMGAIIDRSGRVVRCGRNDSSAECPLIAEQIDRTVSETASRFDAEEGPTPNTTITLVVTNQRLEYSFLNRIAKQVHTSIGRAIQPFATQYDGDVLVAVTTEEVDNPDLSAIDLGVIASELAWDAVLSSVPSLPSTPDLITTLPEPDAFAEYIGTYVFAGVSSLTIEMEESFLSATYRGEENIYFSDGQSYRLLPAAGGVFVVDSPAKDVIKFQSGERGMAKLILNPGPWAQTAIRGRR